MQVFSDLIFIGGMLLFVQTQAHEGIRYGRKTRDYRIQWDGGSSVCVRTR